MSINHLERITAHFTNGGERVLLTVTRLDSQGEEHVNYHTVPAECLSLETIDHMSRWADKWGVKVTTSLNVYPVIHITRVHPESEPTPSPMTKERYDYLNETSKPASVILNTIDELLDLVRKHRSEAGSFAPNEVVGFAITNLDLLREGLLTARRKATKVIDNTYSIIKSL